MNAFWMLKNLTIPWCRLEALTSFFSLILYLSKLFRITLIQLRILMSMIQHMWSFWSNTTGPIQMQRRLIHLPNLTKLLSRILIITKEVYNLISCLRYVYRILQVLIMRLVIKSYLKIWVPHIKSLIQHL